MSAPLLRRTFLLIVPLALLLVGCDGGEVATEAVERCTCEDLAVYVPCEGDSHCIPLDNFVVPWPDPAPESEAGYPMAPAIAWTFPCYPDSYQVHLENYYDTSVATSIIHPDQGKGIQTWLPGVHVSSWIHYDYYIEARLYDPADPLYEEDPESAIACDSLGGGVFHVAGKVCEGTNSSPPKPTSPDDGVELIVQDQSTPVTVEFHFTWGGGWPVGDCVILFEGQVSPDPAFQADVVPIKSVYPDPAHSATAVWEWCHTYYWRVRATGTKAWGAWSEVRTFKVPPPEGWDSCSKGLGEIVAVALQDSACRAGPSTAYGIAGYAAAGDRRMIVGRNADGSWFQTAEGCYINSRLLRVEVVQGTPFPGGADVGSLMSIVPEVPDPPLPTETSAPGQPSGPVCSSSLSPAACAAGGWPYNYDLNICICP